MRKLPVAVIKISAVLMTDDSFLTSRPSMHACRAQMGSTSVTTTRAPQAFIAAATMKVLSTYSVDEVYLNATPSWLFGEKRVIDIYEKFRKNLREVENWMEERNKALEIPYTVLQPSKIPAGIAI